VQRGGGPNSVHPEWLHRALGWDTVWVRPRGPVPVQFFPAPWEVAESDVAGCGPRLFLTGTKLLTGVWERLVKDARLASSNPTELDAISWVILEHGLRALAPVSLRERLGCLLSLRELADSSELQLYYRIVSATGEPVACGFVVLGCAQKATGNAATIPAAIRDYLASHDFHESEQAPSFIERALVLPNAAETLFPDEVRAVGSRIASLEGSVPQRRTPSTPLSIPALGELPIPEGRTAFFFPDAPSYDGRLLCELRAYLPYLADYFDQAEEISRRIFRQSFLPLVDLDAIALHDQRLDRCPELSHVGVVLTGVLIAESLQEHGIRPHALIGDGLGELTALAVAGTADLATALRLAALRALAMRPASANGNGNGNGNGAGTGEHAAVQFADALADVQFDAPRLPIVSLRSGDPFSRLAGERVDSLGATLDDDLTAAAWGAGCEHVIECGPRGFLSSGVRAPSAVLQFVPEVRLDVQA
jgi:acyl-CoA thioesterase FadM